jgi:hypothetical protein
MVNLNTKKLILGAAVLFNSTFIGADQQIQDDLVVVGSICSGLDCVNGESFGFDTLRLKENNLRIKFMDTSSSSSFPTGDWQMTINDSVNGGANWWGIEDIDSSTIPFTILQGAPNYSLYMSSNGNVGFGTTTPLVGLSMKKADSPTIRLTQDTSAGFAEQEWDMGGNETNFFIRDVTNGSALPFRIVPNAPNNSIYVAADGDIGFETSTPDGQFDIAHSSDANNHAFLISPVSYVGINIDNGFVPNALFEVQTTGGKSRLAVKSDGAVGIGTATPSGRFDVRNTDDSLSYFNIDATGQLGIGTNAPTGRFHMKNLAETADLLLVQNDGLVGMGTAAPGANLHIIGSISNIGIRAENTSTTEKSRNMLQLFNNGGSKLNFRDTSADGDIWNILTNANTLTVTRAAFNSGTGLSEDLFKVSGADGGLQSWGDICAFGLDSGTTTKCVGDLTSSKHLKNIINSVDTSHVLDQVSSLPISLWTYKTDDEAVQHIGPMAEDFEATFGLNGGVTDKIAIVDAVGVSLAAIQGLHEQLKQKDQEIQQLKNDIAEIKRLLKLH